MGMMTEGQIRDQLKKGQGETNQRLDALLLEQQKTNALLSQVVALLSAAQLPGGAARTTWGVPQQ